MVKQNHEEDYKLFKISAAIKGRWSTIGRTKDESEVEKIIDLIDTDFYDRVMVMVYDSKKGYDDEYLIRDLDKPLTRKLVKEQRKQELGGSKKLRKEERRKLLREKEGFYEESC